VLLSIVLAATVFSGYLLVKWTDSPVGAKSSQTTRQAATQEAVAEAPKSLARMTSNEKTPDPASRRQDALADCISPAQLESDPVLAAEYARLDSVVTSGPAIQSYRGLSSAQLGDLAVQGDSAAMAVLGAVSVMRARNLPKDKAVDYLLREDPSLWSFSLGQQLEPDRVKHLEEARDWFYQSALHGRLLALQNAGEIIGIVAGTPTELGWIEEDEYESLEGYERHALDPTTVYHALAFEIAPQLRSGPFGPIISELAPGGERRQLILDELARQFNEDREAAQLPPIVISASTAPAMEEFESMLCEPYLDSVP
jgi:hypothetical protein